MKFQRGLRILFALRSARIREHMIRMLDAFDSLPEQTCPCCQYYGKFDSFGDVLRMGANCPRCESKERHRLFAIATAEKFLTFGGFDVLHFAPEPTVSSIISNDNPKSYVTADYERGRADIQLDIEAISLPNESYDRIVCSHVLEHVDDGKAFSELYRILRPSGQLIVMIPIIEGWSNTYEDHTITKPEQRKMHFQQWDHIRLYGADFRGRAISAGFNIDEFTAGPLDSIKYGLWRGEKVFVLTKAA